MLVWWTSLVFGFSSQPYSAQTIQPWMKSLISEQKLAKVVPSVTVHYHHATIVAKKEPYRYIEFLFRKSAHLFVYAMLGAIFCALLSTLKQRGYRIMGIVFLYVLTISSLDEWNQARVTMRTSAIQDVIVDLVGGCIGITAVLLLMRTRLGRAINPSTFKS
ncbi:VanZ family protein [Paenibacillus baekrokdamisoli]|uniref:VanZ family protein n=1 Tax=Paenibacillus baekrokdamisoli TaxID=1712516 RepID=UPI0021A73681|nr:VanZ family protein [Paenibacillus baekrokdamisoli]